MTRSTLFICLALFGCAPAPQSVTKSNVAQSSDGDSPMQLVQHAAEGTGDPEIEISNLADRAIAIEFVGPQSVHVDIPGSEARTVKLAAGKYSVRLLSDTLPSEQTFEFARDYQYSLQLKLYSELDHPAYRGKGYECFDIQSKPTYYHCSRTASGCKNARKSVPAQFVIGECEHHADIHYFRAKNSAGKLAAIFTATASDCETMRKTYIAQKSGTDVGECESGK